MGKIVRLKIPKSSNSRGWIDYGVSENLNKPASFRYSESFLKKWYDPDVERFVIIRKRR